MLNKLALLFLIFVPITSFSQINCPAVETLGNASREYLIDELKQELTQRSFRVSKNIYLKVTTIPELTFRDCEMKVIINFYIRRYGRILKGLVNVKAYVAEFNGRSACLKDPKVTNIELNSKKILLNRVTKLFKNIVIPPQTCFHI